MGKNYGDDNSVPSFVTDLVGKVITEITGAELGSEEVIITTLCGARYRMYHRQDCCEEVEVDTLIGSVPRFTDCVFRTPVTEAEELISGPAEDERGSITRTLYRFTVKDGRKFVIGWKGESNGFYSESVSFDKITPFDPVDPDKDERERQAANAAYVARCEAINRVREEAAYAVRVAEAKRRAEIQLLSDLYDLMPPPPPPPDVPRGTSLQ